MGIIQKEDIATLDEIRGYKVVKKEQVTTMQNFIVKYVDNKVHICPHCPAQVKFAFNRIINWASKNSEAIEAVRNSNTCECGEALPDKRYKYCDACKNDK